MLKSQTSLLDTDTCYRHVIFMAKQNKYCLAPEQKSVYALFEGSFINYIYCHVTSAVTFNLDNIPHSQS